MSLFFKRQDEMKGSLFIVAAPSGAGKTSLVNALVKQDASICLSVSHTTRAARAGEVDGQDYHFVDQATFAEMRDAGAFLESATVFDNSYGTSAAAVEAQLEKGLDVILEIDWQGAQQVRRNFKESTGVFILPPSKKTLEERLRGRGQDDESIIQRRMRDAENEISHYVEFDYVIVNDDFDEALQSLAAVIVTKRHELAKQQVAHQTLIAELLS
jgi:guanylate kinase